MKNKLKNLIKNKKMQIELFLYSVVTSVTFTTISAHAAENSYAKNFGDWVTDGIKTLVTVAAVGAIGFSILKRKFIQLIVTIVVAGIIMALVFNPDIVKNIGETLVKVVTGGK